MKHFYSNKKNFLVVIMILVLGLLMIFDGGVQRKHANDPKVVHGQADVSDWNFNVNGKAYLRGQWEIHPGFLKTENIPQHNSNIGRFWINTGKGIGSHSPVTLRIKLKLNPKMLYAIGVANDRYARFRIWINGNQVEGEEWNDSALLSSFGFRDVKARDLDEEWFASGKDGELEVVLHTSYAIATQGIVLAVDEMENHLHDIAGSRAVNTALIGALIIMCLYHMIFYFFLRTDKAPLYLSLVCASMACMLVLNNFDISLAKYFQLDVTAQNTFMLRCVMVAAMLYSGSQFTNTLFKNEAVPRFCKIIRILLGAWVIGVVSLHFLTDIAPWMRFYSLGNILIVLFVAYYCIVVIRAFIRKRDGAGIFLTSYIFTALVAAHDVLVDLEKVTSAGFYYHYGLMCIIISVAVILSKRFASLYQQQESSAMALQESHNALRQKNLELHDMWEEVTISRNELAGLNTKLEEIVQRRTSTIRNLLDNAGQGFLSFDSSLMVEEDYSIECRSIFGRDIRNMRIVDLLGEFVPQERDTIENIFIRVLQHTAKRDAYLSLLPQKIEVRGKLIQLEYKLITADIFNGPEKMMLVLTDITDKDALEKALEQKRRHLEMVVKVVVHPKDFYECVSDYANFCSNEYREILSSMLSGAEKRVQILRKIHTLKGNFAQFGIESLVYKLHVLENQIIEYNADESDMEMDKFNQLLDVDEMECWLRLEIENLESILGKGYIARINVVTIEIDKLIDIENRIREMFPDKEGEMLLRELKKLRYRPLRDMLEPYVDYSLKMAERLNKNLIVLLDVDDGIMIDSERYNGFIKSLVHVFRNAVDHGIESDEIRLENGKSAIGCITCKAGFEDGQHTLVVAVSDDGNGIDPRIIRDKALEAGFIGKDQVDNIPEAELIRLILKDSFSTAQETTMISGRGVGMGATAAEVELLKGSVDIKNRCGEGVSFIFRIPNEG